MNIKNNINRIDLHDSVFQTLEKESNSIILILDWTIIEDYQEEDIHEPIILGKTIFSIEGISHEIIKVVNVKTNIPAKNPKSVLFNNKCKIKKYKINDNAKSITIEGNISINKEAYFTLWKFKYERCEVNSNSYYTLSNWINGELSSYLNKVLLPTQVE